MPSNGPAPSVLAKVFGILTAFDPSHTRLTLSEIAKRSGLPISTTHRLLQDLVEWNALHKGSDGRYEVGTRMWAIGLLAPLHLELRHAASGPMQDIFFATGENVHIAVLDGNTALYVDRISGRNSVPIISRAGSRLPLHATGVGKVLLAYADDETRAAAYRQANRITRYTITEPGKLNAALDEVRNRGFAQTCEEMTLGAASLAVPVFAPDGQVIAALGIVAKSLRVDLLKLLPAMQTGSRTITRALRET